MNRLAHVPVKQTDQIMSKPSELSQEPGFSHPLMVADLPKNRARTFDLDLSDGDLAVIVDDLGILDLAKLRFTGEIAFNDQGEAEVTADLGVTATQACVVTLEPVKTRIDEKITRRFSPHMEPRADEYQMLEDEDENVDPLTDVIDLGLILTESIALNLPDFPRVEGAELSQTTFAEDGVTPLEDEDTKPFASLAALKDKLSPKE